jgi:hypothetical protein
MSDELLKRLLNSAEALQFLKDHPEFGGTAPYRAGKRAFSRNANPDVALFMEKLELVRDRLPETQQKVADWFVSLPPREVATRYNVPVKDVYRAYESLRESVEAECKLYRAEQVGGRAGKADLETLPEHCAIATRHFVYRGRKQVVYRVDQNRGPVWVDAGGKIFNPEVQEVLDELHEHAADFLEIEGE